MTSSNYDSEFCGSLPIHLTNMIQPYGILVVIARSSGKIIQVSENAEKVFGVPAKSLIDTPLANYISADQQDRLADLWKDSVKDRIPLTWTIQSKQYLSLIHLKKEYVLAEVEAEPFDANSQDSFVKVFQDIKFTMSSIEAGASVQKVCDIAAAELKRLSGFDKIMVYQFDEQWNGTVITEVHEPGMESYLDFTFPASDIPKPARDLYLKNPYRLIPDRNYQPVKLHPVINPITHAFLDLSDCNLRSIVAVHLEYLKNMGVVSSMSFRILKEDKLWGLIACHHREPKYLSYQMCSVFEMLSTILSAKVTSLINGKSHAYEAELQEKYTALVEEAYRTNSLEETLLGKKGLMQLLNATGIAISTRGKIETVGKVPSRDQLEELILWLHTKQLKSNYNTTSLSGSYDLAEGFAGVGSGVLIIPTNFVEDEYIILFRPEVIQVIKWGGDPGERIQFEKDQKNYHPRFSFQLWQQKVNATSLAWKAEETEMAEKIRSFIFEYRAANPVRA